MAKRNQVTVNLSVATDMKLKNTQSFIKQLEKLTNEFDFGTKMNNQIDKAKMQLIDYSKFLSKIQNKSLISDEEIKELTKVSQEITNLTSKVEGLYKNFNSSDWNKYSKKTIALEKERQEAIAKIKQQYTKETGKDYDKEYANLDKMKEKARELQKTIKDLENSKQGRISNKIKEENKYYQSQLDTLNEVKRLQNELNKSKNNIIDKYSKQTGFSQKELTSKITPDRYSIQKELANNKYNELLNVYNQLQQKKEAIMNSGKKETTIQKQLIKLATEYNLKNVKTISDFEKQNKALEKQKNFYRNLNNRQQLVTEKEITNEINRRNKLLETQSKMNNDITTNQKKILSSTNYDTANDLNSTGKQLEKILSSAKINVTNTTAKLNSDGEQSIANEITAAIKDEKQTLGQILRQTNNSIKAVEDTNQQIATRSNLLADEQDVVNGASRQINATNEDGAKTRQAVTNTQNNILNSLKQSSEKAGGRLDENLTKLKANPVEDLFGILKRFNISSIIKDEDIKTINRLTDEYNEMIGNLNRYQGYLKQDLTFKEYREIGSGAQADAGDAKEVANKISEIISEELEKIKGNKERQLDAMSKHDRTGRVIKDQNGFPTLKKGYTSSDYNAILNEVQMFSKVQSLLSSTVSEIGNDLTQTAIDLKNYNNNINEQNEKTIKANNSLKYYSQSMGDIDVKIKKASQQVQYIGSVFDDLRNKVNYFLSMNYIIDAIIRKIREASTFVKELDKDMVQIGLVLGQTSSQVWKNFNTYSQMADKLNTTTSEVTKSMKLFYQQGLNTSEVNKMVEASAIAAALGESTMAEASETLTSIINSYNLSANQALNVTDKISMVAIASAADFGELSTAIEKVASSAASAGLDLDHMMGYLAKMIETTREAPTNVGTALKTIVANFTQFKEDPSAINEDGSGINRVDKALKSVGISLTDTNGDVKDLSEVLDELGGKWNSLTRNQKSYLATQIAGTRQQSRFYALMNDYDRTLQLVEESINSDGKATEQFALYQESLTASTKKLSNEWEKFYNKTLKNNNALKFLQSTAVGLLKIANKLGPAWSAVISMLAFKELRKGWSFLNTQREELQNINKALQDFRVIYNKIVSAQGQLSTNGNNLDIFSNYNFNGIIRNKGKIGNFINSPGSKIANFAFDKNDGAEKVKVAQQWDAISKAVSGATEADKEFLKTNEETLIKLLGREKAIEVLEGKISTETAAVIANNTATSAEAANDTIVTATKWGRVAATLALNAAIFAGVGIAVLAVKAISNYMNKEHEAAIASQERTKAIKEEQQDLEKLINKYDDLSKKVALSESEKEELKNTIEELAEAYPELVEGIDAEGNAYLVANEKLKEYLKNQKQRLADSETETALTTLNDKKQKNNPYTDKNIFWSGVSKSDNFFNSNVKSASQELQSSIDIYKNYKSRNAELETNTSEKIGKSFLSSVRNMFLPTNIMSAPINSAVEKMKITKNSNVAKNMEKAIFENDFQKLDKNIENERNANNKAIKKANDKKTKAKTEEDRIEAEKTINDYSERNRQLDTIKNRAQNYRNSLQTGYADVAKGKYSSTVEKYKQDNNFNDEQTNVVDSLLQNYYKEQMKNYNNGDEMRKAIKDGKLTEGVDEILENVSLLTQNEIDDYNKLIENYKTGKLSLDDLEGNLDDYSDSIKELAQNYIKDAQEEIEKMAGVDTDQYNEVDLGKGNIDLNKRPTYTNPDGSVSTVDSVSVNLDGIETLLPSVWQNADGTVTHADAGTEEGMQQILAHYEETGEYLGKFKTALEADTYALELHEKQAQQQNERNNGEEIKQRRIENLSQVSGKTRELLATNKANFLEGSDFTKDQYEIAYKNALDNPDFLKDLDKLDRTDLAKVSEFKQKYAQALGEFGEKYIRELTKQEYDAEKTQSSLTKAQQGMTTQNKNGVSFNDISQGSVSQEDAFNELTNSAENARRNITTVGQDLIVTGQEIAQSFEESQREALNSLQGIINNAEDNIKDYKKQLENWDETGFDNLSDQEKEQYEQTQKNIASEQNRIIQAKKLAEAYSKVTIEQEAINKNQHVITGFAAVDREINSLKELADMYQYVGNARMSQLDIIQAVAENTDLLAALEVNERGELYLSKQGIEAIAAERIGEAKATVDAQISKLEAMKSMINGDQVYSDYELEMLENMAEEWLNMSDDQKNALIAQAQQLGYNVQSMDDWTNFVQRDLQGAIKAWDAYHNAAAGQEGQNAITGSSGGVVNNAAAKSKERKTKGNQKKAEIQAEIDRLKAVSSKLGQYQKNPSKLLNDVNKLGDYKNSGGGGGGGSDDAYDQKIEKLEYFYNYLRKIEKLEAKIEKLRTKRSIIDETENYYIDDLIKENKLLKEQSSLYEKYINDQASYLAELRQQLSANYSDWVGFDNEGAVQVKRVKYAIKSEAEEERYQEYSELLNEYQSQYQTYLDTQNSLLSAQQTIIENIKTAYDKINQKLEDTMDNLDRINSINEHNSEMAIGNLKQLSAYNKELSSTVNMYNYASQALTNLKADMNEIANKVNSMNLGQYMTWDSNANQYMTNDNFNNAVTNGTIDNETLTTIQTMVAASQSLNNEWEQMYDRISDIESSLKSIIENRLSAIEELIGGWTDEVSALFDIINRQLSVKDTVMDLVGYDTKDLEDKYKLVANAAAMTKLSWEETQKLTKQALDNLTAEYGNYVQMINDTPFINEKGIEESAELTDIQKEKAKELITTYKQLKDATENLEDATYDYLNTLKELQEEQLNQTIDIMQQIHDELRNIDQEELNDLKEKYDKMTALDNEYYSKLSQRINDFRNERTKLQDQQTLVQKQNQLSALQQDNSGQYNSQIVDLQNEINQLLQNKADTNVDDQLERIQREQEQRAEDRAMQEQQLENLITFKDENKVYWEQALEMLGEGYAVVSGFLATREQNADQSELATQEAIAQTNQKLENVYARLDQYTVKDIQTSADIKGMINDFLNGGGDNSISGLLNKLGLVDSDINTNLTNQFKDISSVINDGFSSSFGQIANGLNQFWAQFGQLRENITGNLTTTTRGISNAVSSSGTGIINAVNSSIGQVHSDNVSIGATNAEIKKNTKSTADNSGSTAGSSKATAANTGSSRGGVGNSVDNLASEVDNNINTQDFRLQGIIRLLGDTNVNVLKLVQKINRGFTIDRGEIGIRGSFLGGLGLNVGASRGRIYKTGGYADYTGPAWVDGTKTKPEAFLNAKQTALFETLRDTLAKVPKINTKEDKDSEGIMIENFNIDVKELADTDSIDKVVKTVKDSIYKDATSGNNMKINRRR